MPFRYIFILAYRPHIHQLPILWDEVHKLGEFTILTYGWLSPYSLTE